MTEKRLRKIGQTKQELLSELHSHVSSLQPDDGDFMDMKFRNALADAIGQARECRAPMGDPDHIDGVTRRYAQAASMVDMVHGDLRKVARAGLPAVWVGTAGEKASEVINAASYSADEMSHKFQEAGPALRLLAEGIREAQARDDFGRSALDTAQSILQSSFFAEREELLRAKTAVLDGIRYLKEADGRAKDAGEESAKRLTKLASEARAGKVTARGLTDADRLVLADAANPGGPQDLNEILTADELKRSSQFMDKMSAKDQAEFDRLLSGANSPQERAYLMKALAAGHGIAELRSFGKEIHGKDATWLREHLSPFHTTGDTGTGIDSAAEFTTPGGRGAEWTQGTYNTCVASSTVTARALVDPLYALNLTSGGRPGNPKYDNPEAFNKRLLDEQLRVHQEGGQTDPYNGLALDAKKKVLDGELSAYSGSPYEHHRMNSAEARRDSLPLIEKAVDEGKPVPIGVEGYSTGTNGQQTRSGHAMLIVGHEGDQLQIYNPWGHTVWVSEDDFINNRMDKAADHKTPNAYVYSLPR